MNDDVFLPVGIVLTLIVVRDSVFLNQAVWAADFDGWADLPAPLPGQPTDMFLRNYGASQTWGMQVEQIRLCQTALAAWQAGWEAGHAGKPKDPAAP